MIKRFESSWVCCCLTDRVSLLLGTSSGIIWLLFLDRGRLGSFGAGSFIVYICLLVYFDWIKLLGPSHVSLCKTWTSSSDSTSNYSRRLSYFRAAFGEVVSSLDIDIWAIKWLRISLGASHRATQLVLLFLCVDLLLGLLSSDFRQIYNGVLFVNFRLYLFRIIRTERERCLIDAVLIVKASQSDIVLRNGYIVRRIRTWWMSRYTCPLITLVVIFWWRVKRLSVRILSVHVSYCVINKAASICDWTVTNLR